MCKYFWDRLLREKAHIITTEALNTSILFIPEADPEVEQQFLQLSRGESSISGSWLSTQRSLSSRHRQQQPLSGGRTQGLQPAGQPLPHAQQPSLPAQQRSLPDPQPAVSDQHWQRPALSCRSLRGRHTSEQQWRLLSCAQSTG
jgi:hypothetical protein